MANILWVDNAKARFLYSKIVEFQSWRKAFIGNTMEKFKRIHVNFLIMTKKRKRNKTVMMFMLKMTVQY